MAFIVKIMHLFWFLVFASVGSNVALSSTFGGASSEGRAAGGATPARGGSTRISPPTSSSSAATTSKSKRRFQFVPRRSDMTSAVTSAAAKIQHHHQVHQNPPAPPPPVAAAAETTESTTDVTTKKIDAISGGTSSMSASIFNLVNNVAGAGILTLSAGMASGTGWVSASLICAVLGFLSSHTFTLIGEACALTGEKDFKGLWARTMGPNSTFVVDGMITILCLACTVIYSGMLGDVFTQLLALAGLPAHMNGRSSNILALTATMLFPLCMIKNLSSLAFTSVLGFSAIMYTVLFIVVRSLDGTYGVAGAAGKFVSDGILKHVPSFTKSSLWRLDFTSLVLASNLGLAYIAHYNGPAFYRELKDTNSKRFGTMVRISFSLLTALYVVTMVAGYKTFGDVCQGNLLLNYHPKDVLSTLGRLATGCSILFGYPLVAAGAREGLSGCVDGIKNRKLTSSKKQQQQQHQLSGPSFGETHHLPLVLSILTFATVVACTVKDVSLVVGLTGAAMGSMIVFLFPVLIYCKAIAQQYGMDSVESKRAKMVNYGLLPFGALIGGLGVFMTLKGAS